jgi:hypothetical protein
MCQCASVPVCQWASVPRASMVRVVRQVQLKLQWAVVSCSVATHSALDALAW